MLGGFPQDEDPILGPDDFPPGGPFDLFGFGQQGPGPAAPGPQQLNQQQQFGPFPFAGGAVGQNNQAAGGQQQQFGPFSFGGGAAEQNNQAAGGQQQHLGPFPLAGDAANQIDQAAAEDIAQDNWPDQVQNIPAFNLNEDPEQPHLDLNVVPDMQEMIIDPVQVNHQQEMFLELNNLLNQVNEEEEHEAEIQEIQEEQNVEVN